MPQKSLHITYEDAFRAVSAERDMWRDRYLALQEEFNHYLQQEIAVLKQTEPTKPLPNDYVGLVKWLEREKLQGHDYYAEAGFNRSRMCRELTGIIGWVVDQNSLRKAQN